ncbi:DUF551 domain-containing protein [Escherichia coli]|uniref:DUF551 domain-containing protein n=1 Tax=Escherichia coli TaxID=562 RepID=UPI0027D32E39|nr:DUF551 domain-containing protein [Escherichia coli]
MAELTKEWLKQTIAEYEANRDELPFGLDTNSAIELQAFKLALASLEADPVAYIFKHPAGKLFWALTDESNKDQSDVIPVYASPPVPVVPAALPENDDEDGHDIDYLEPSEVYALGRTAGWNACRAAMLQGSQPVSQTNKLPVNTPCQDAPAHIWLQTAGVWPEDGELSELTWCSHNQHHDDTLYVRADLVNGNYPVTPDGWISCSERMPEKNQNVLISVNFDSSLVEPLICSARYTGSTFRRGDATIKPGNGIEQATHWMPLPEPPQEAK